MGSLIWFSEVGYFYLKAEHVITCPFVSVPEEIQRRLAALTSALLPSPFHGLPSSSPPPSLERKGEHGLTLGLVFYFTPWVAPED